MSNSSLEPKKGKKMVGWIAILALFLLLVIGMVGWPLQANSPASWQRFTFGDGGGRLQTSLYSLDATIGQPSAVGRLTSDQFNLQAGYWVAPRPQLTPPPPPNRAIYLPFIGVSSP